MPVKSISAKQLGGALDAIRDRIGKDKFDKLPPLRPSVGPIVGTGTIVGYVISDKDAASLGNLDVLSRDLAKRLDGAGAKPAALLQDGHWIVGFMPRGTTIFG
jgi:hypothetical protein